MNVLLWRKRLIKISDIEVDYIDHMGTDASVSRAARVSFANDGKDFDDVKDTKLIQYLAKHGHISPFHHTFITVRVKAPIFVRSQAVKHKFMPVNEVSRRYCDDDFEFYIPQDWRLRAENVKQGSSDEIFNGLMFINNDGDGDNHGDAHDAAKHVAQVSIDIYNGMLSKGICPEMARSCLPQSMMTTFYWSGTLSAFADMLKLRLDSHAQKEIQYMSQKIRDIIEPLFPVSLKALLNNG